MDNEIDLVRLRAGGWSCNTEYVLHSGGDKTADLVEAKG